jgi:PilZ domain
MGSIPPPSRGDSDAQRRSQRVMLKVSVIVLVHGTDNKVVSEVTRTVTVNAHGAKILLGLKVSIGEVLMLRNSGTGEEVSCRVVYISPHQAEKKEVGLDFITPSPGFWRISFPPTDWTMRSPEAKSSPGPSSAKKNSKTKR